MAVVTLGIINKSIAKKHLGTFYEPSDVKHKSTVRTLGADKKIKRQ